MTVAQIIDDAMAVCNHTAAPTEIRNRFLRSVNAWQRRILTKPGFIKLLRDASQTLTTVASQQVYGFSYPLGRLSGMYDVANRRPLYLKDLAWLRLVDSGITTSGTPTHYIPKGWFPVAQHPTTASSIWIASDSGDTRLINGEFLLSDGSRRIASASLNGTTYVQFGTLTTVVQVLKLQPDSVSGSRINTIRSGSGTGTILGLINPGEVVPRYFQVQLWPAPSAPLSYLCDFTRELADMIEDDVPLLPPDFQFILSLGAQRDEFRKMDDDRWQDLDADIERSLKNLNAWLWDLPGDAPYDGVGAGTVGLSRLGAWFPSGS